MKHLFEFKIEYKHINDNSIFDKIFYSKIKNFKPFNGLAHSEDDTNFSLTSESNLDINLQNIFRSFGMFELNMRNFKLLDKFAEYDQISFSEKLKNNFMDTNKVSMAQVAFGTRFYHQNKVNDLFYSKLKTDSIN